MSGEDLRAILGLREEGFAAELREHRVDEVSAQRVLSRSRRALRVRSGAVAAVAAVAVTIAGVGVWALTGQQHREPLVAPPSPSPVTVSASPTPSPTPTPSASPKIVFPAPLPADGLFLEAQQLTQSVWLAADDGWSLTYWQPSRQSRAVDSQEVTDPGVAAIYLMDSNGNRYEVSHFDVPVDAEIQLVAWEPTEFAATVIYDAEVRKEGGTSNPELAVLDLRTGAITVSDVVAPPTVFFGVNSDNNLLFRTGNSGEDVTVLTRSLDVVGVLPGRAHDRLSPDGTTLVHETRDDSSGQPLSLDAYSATTGEGLWSQDVTAVTSVSGLYCDLSGWITRNTPALTCKEHGPIYLGYYTGATTFFAVDQDGVSAAIEPPGDLSWGSPYPFPAGLVSCGGDQFDGGESCSLYYIEGASLVPVPMQTVSTAWRSFTESGDVVALKVLSDVAGPPFSVTAIRYDTGVTFTIASRQQDEPALSWKTVSGVVIAGAVGPAF
ncbi:hypothetical protein [Demequina lutea]|uniref:Uncharacterized protein n=1 Tax=Demequina lutea TaxID=431489 RepID=A0A7Z0CJ05_9MICO|nr:hypothetical protein [Demequina lutea]NYI42524.1 hypothetical protein [Demequina lutea]